MPVITQRDDGETNPLGEQVFQLFPDPEDPQFDEIMAIQVDDIVRSRQMHNPRHTASCFKYGTSECRLRFPRELFDFSFFDLATQVIRIQRDHPWLNGYNRWFSLTLRANHDIQFLHTRDHALAIIYYILKYISKSEQSLYSKLAIAASVRTAQMSLANEYNYGQENGTTNLQ